MPLNYRIDPARIPKKWRDNITPAEDDTGLYYTISQICEKSSAVEDEIPADIRKKYKHDGTDFYKWVYYSDPDMQTTIPELRVDDNYWLTLSGSNPRLYDPSIYDRYDGDVPLVLKIQGDSNHAYMIYNLYGFQYTNYAQSETSPPYGELDGGIIFQSINFSYSDHEFAIWGDGAQVVLREFMPPTSGGGGTPPSSYSNTPSTYTFPGHSSFPQWGRGGTLPLPVDAVLVTICGAGGGGRPGSLAANGAGGGAGATGIFKVSLKNTSEEYPIYIKLGHAGGSSQGGTDSYITYTSAGGITEGFYVGGGGTGRSNDDPGMGGYGGKVKNFNSNPHKQIKLYDYVDGADGGKDISREKLTIGKTGKGSSFLLRTGKGNSAGNGGNSAFAGGGGMGAGYSGSFGAHSGGGGDTPGGGGGAGMGPSQLGGDGGSGGAPYLLVTY